MADGPIDPGPCAADRTALTAAEAQGFLEDAAKLWLAHDGLWFQSVERRWGTEAALECDREAWAHFSPLEAQRILARLGLAAGGGLAALQRALGHRLYSHLNEQTCELPEPGRLIFRMRTCRVQAARRRKGLPDFPCRSVGIVEYETFARAIDPRVKTRCLTCPPDPPLPGVACAWEFTLSEEAES